MKTFSVIFLSMVLSVSAFAKQVELVCHTRHYVKSPHSGEWYTSMGFLRSITLIQDPSYPNPGYPWEHWSGVLKQTLENGSQASLRVEWTNNPDRQPFSADLTLTNGDIVASSSGAGSVSVDLRSSTVNDGFLCWGFKLK